MKQYKNFINGRFVESDRRFAGINPATGIRFADVHEATRETVDAAVEAGHEAVRGWGATSVVDRADMLYRIADEIDRRADDFLDAEVSDTGKPVSLASRLDIPRGAANFRIFADILKTAPLDTFRTELPGGAQAINYTVRKPLGVVGIISPWNLPLLLFSWKVAPALACGNAVVAKPSEETPGTATLLAEVMQTAGLPPGVFNLVHGFGPDSAGEFISTHPRINAITFTGESKTGTAIMHAAAEGVKPVSFELGGKNAAIIFADCDFDKTVEGMTRAAFLNSGQVCLCSERIFVERTIYDRFVKALAERAKAIKLGAPTDETTGMGPVISAAHRDKVLSYYALAREEGAEFIVGGGIPRFGNPLDGGFWVEPTLIAGLADDARCVTEEIFGPVGHISPFDSEAEVIRRANAT
ncbi:2-hydroxymuconic semialdehyde dehydrogenase, partial [Burkholderia contaminans]